MNSYQEPKYKIEGGKVINRQSNETIPDDEPIFILRARDVHAAGVLIAYSQMVKDRQHQEAVRMRAAQFSNWAAVHHARMHEPDTQIDTGWTAAGNPPPS